MNHPPVLRLLLVMAVGTTLAAQEPQQGQGGKGDAVDKGKDQQDLAARVAKNMKASEERLKKTDPGDVTRKIQRDIVDDLDEMIKQNDKSKGGSGKSGQRSKRNQSGGQTGGDPSSGLDKQPSNPKDGQRDDARGQENDKEHGTAKGGNKDDGQGKDKDQGKGNQGVAKDGGEGDKDKGSAKGKQPGGKDGKDSVAGGLGSSKRDVDKAKRDLAADLFRAEWGKLPDKMRLEMDVYSKERFMPRYDDLLRQYYRSIAEQSMKKDD
jgi:hypothetical protein